MAKHYNTRVRHRDFQVRDLVLRKVTGTIRDPSKGKLGLNWEGPYQNHFVAKKKHLSSGDTRRTKVASSMEHRAPKEILPVDNRM